ncbi:MAG: adenylyl-sulfate kinase [Clostridia bacterium]|nr:adenylyl-sulfate kinase [Clostridia bacterium]
MVFHIAEGNRRLTEDAAAFIREADAAYDARLEEIAAYIRAHADTCPVVLLSGPSGSGKTTTAMMLEKKLDTWGYETHTLSMDNYFRTLTPEQHRLLEEEKLDLESPERVDIPLLTAQLQDIVAGRTVQVPRFDFHAHARAADTVPLTRKPGEVVILEGIHALNPAVVTLPEEQTVRLYVSVRTRVETAEGRILHPMWLRLLRRMLRDTLYRGRQPADTLQMFASVQRGEDAYIMPYKYRSTFDVDTFCPYEVYVYRRYLWEQLQPLARHAEVAGLLPVLAEAQPLDKELVPETSLIREFIGDSVYHK